MKLLLTLLACSLLGGCVSGQITVQCDQGGTNSRLLASHKDTDQNPTSVSAAIPVGVGAQPNTSGTANGAPAIPAAPE